MIIDNKKEQKRRVGIYIHVPFCRSKCYYCDFCSKTRVSDEQTEQYTRALCAEIEFIAQKIKESGADTPLADTVYFGGGTPTLLSPKMFEKILLAVNEHFGIADGAEITAETNPKTADYGKLCDIRGLGINRLSIGMQSVHDSELKKLGRIHSFSDFCNTYNDARHAGFDNISADLMYGIPDQTKESFARSVKTLAELDPEHISSYCLTIEEKTHFDRHRDELVLPSEDTVADMYSDLTQILESHGYNKYEISNFAHKSRESKHNIKYWRLEDYLGFGPAAYSCFDSVRYGHTRDIAAYTDGKKTYCDVEKTELIEQMNEYVMLGLRMSDGIMINDFEMRFGISFNDAFGKKIAKFTPEHVYMDSEVCRFTPRGMFVSNFILSDILDFEK